MVVSETTIPVSTPNIRARSNPTRFYPKNTLGGSQVADRQARTHTAQRREHQCIPKQVQDCSESTIFAVERRAPRHCGWSMIANCTPEDVALGLKRFAITARDWRKRDIRPKNNEHAQDCGQWKRMVFIAMTKVTTRIGW